MQAIYFQLYGFCPLTNFSHFPKFDGKLRIILAFLPELTLATRLKRLLSSILTRERFPLYNFGDQGPPPRTHTLQKLQVVFKRFSFLVCIFRSCLQVDTWPHRLQLLRLSPHRSPTSNSMQVGIKCLYFMNDFIFIFISSLSFLYLYLHHNATCLQMFSFHEHLEKPSTRGYSTTHIAIVTHPPNQMQVGIQCLPFLDIYRNQKQLYVWLVHFPTR